MQKRVLGGQSYMPTVGWGQGGSALPSEYLPTDEAVVCEAKHCCAYGAGGRDGQSAE